MQKRLLLIAYFFIYANCFAQQYPFVHYTPKDGLVNSRVRKAYQDSKGRMYFMTFGGLSVYDGARFTNYTVQNGLATDMINDLVEVGDDSIWIATNTNGLNFLRHGKIGRIKTADSFYPVINKFFKSEDGQLYVIADQGLFVFRENRFTRLPFIDSKGRDAGKFLSNIAEWKRYLIIISDPVLSGLGPANLYLYDRSTKKITVQEEKENISAICVTGHKIYVSTEKGIMQLDTNAVLNNKIHYVPAQNSLDDIKQRVGYIYPDGQNNLWLYSMHGKIIRIDPSGTKREFSKDNGLSSNNFTYVFRDKEGSTWITMNGSGIDKLVNDNMELYDRFMGVAIDNLFTNELTDSVFLYSYSGKKIFIVSRQKITEYEYEGDGVFPYSFIVSGGKIYIGDGKNLYILDPDKQRSKIKLLSIFTDTAEAGIGNNYNDPYQNLVLCGESYLTVLAGNTLLYRYPVKDHVDQIGFDKENRLWATSRNGDVFVLKINPGRPGKYFELIKNFDKNFPAFSPRSLVVDHSNNVWVGTRHDGLYCFQFDQQLNIRSFKQYTTKEGLSDNFVVYLTCDKENNIWASTSSGLDKISFDSNKTYISNITRGNNIYEQTLKTLVNKEGVAWSYTLDGNLIRVGKNKDSLPFIPSLFITSLKIGNSTADSLLDPASLSYKQNSFFISVAAPSFYDEHQVKYSYLLQGSSNDQWSEPSNNSTFNFINLNPGKYVLKIKASFPAGRYPDQTIDYAFVIHPPWWQSLLFRLIAACMVLGLLITGIRFYYQRKLEKQRIALEKQQAVEKERTRIATDIHDDLGSGLSRIRYLGEMVKLKSSQQQNILPDIEKISVFSDEMVDKMNEIVWALNEKNDSLEAIIFYTRSFAAEYLSNNDIECRVNLPGEVPRQIIKGEVRRNIFLSVKECLHNIVKHAGAKKADIDISITDRLVIKIHDNGNGIDWEKMRPFSNGIMNIRKRMKDAGGSVDFKNENGTTVVLTIPL